jgi:hypothetical protein
MGVATRAVEQGSAERGAGIGEARSRGPVYGDATVEPIMGASQRRSMRAAGGQIPEGPSSAPRRAPVSGDVTREGRGTTDMTAQV